MRFYLIRRALETYLGPMTVQELRSAYKRMEFGLQDEVAGHLGKWVSLDDVKTLDKDYPEIATIVKEEFLGGWGISHHPERLKSDSSKKQKKKSSPLGLILIILAMVSIGGGFAILRNYPQLTSMIFSSESGPDVRIAEKYFEKGDYDSFESYVNQVLPTILPKVSSSRSAYNDWIPYLRVIAFNSDGKIEGLKPKLLRGLGTFTAPADCSLASWKERFLKDQSSWQGFINGETVLKQDWAQMLVWDPYWIKKRNKIAGWIQPINYYEGCLIMAKKAIEELETSPAPGTKSVDIPDAFLVRVGNMLEIIRGQPKNVITENQKGVLADLSCLESKTEKSDELDSCVGKNSPYSSEWQSYLISRKNSNDLRIFLDKHKLMTDENLGTLSKLSDKIRATDDIDGFSYLPEKKFVVTILLNNGSVKEAQRRIKYEFPEIDFEK